MMFPELTSLKRISVAACSFVAASVAAASLAFAADRTPDSPSALSVVLDRAKVIRIAKAADTIIIGNPSIVDATIQDARTLVLTGRNFGTTNLIVLDSEGDAIVDETIVVKGDETRMVRIYRQSVRQTLTCSPVCENTLSVGDAMQNFQDTNTQISSRNKLAESNSDD